MRNTSEAVTLASLRARTDRDLIAIISATVERGFYLLDCESNGSSNEQHRAQAERAYADAAKLLPLVYTLSESERNRLETNLSQLRSALEGTSTRVMDSSCSWGCASSP